VPTHLRYFLLYLIYLWESEAGRSPLAPTQSAVPSTTTSSRAVIARRVRQRRRVRAGTALEEPAERASRTRDQPTDIGAPQALRSSSLES